MGDGRLAADNRQPVNTPSRGPAGAQPGRNQTRACLEITKIAVGLDILYEHTSSRLVRRKDSGIDERRDVATRRVSAPAPLVGSTAYAI